MSRPKISVNPVCGIRLKQILKEQGITQTQAGEFLHLSQKTISHMVNGESSVTNETADLMIKEFPQYSKAWLLGIDDYKTKNDEMKLYETNEYLKFITNCNKLIEIVLGFVEGLEQDD